MARTSYETTNVSDEIVKLEQAKKSCRTTAKIIRIFEVLGWIATAMAVVGGGMCLGLQDIVDNWLTTAEQHGAHITYSTGGLVKMAIDGGSDIPNASTMGAICFAGGVMCAMVAIVFMMIRKTFAYIAESEAPFSDEVSRRLKICFIIMTIAVLLTAGAGIGFMTGLVLWSFYRIFDYGKVLQQQADETL